jgi:hypothetical protein
MAERVSRTSCAPDQGELRHLGPGCGAPRSHCWGGDGAARERADSASALHSSDAGSEGVVCLEREPWAQGCSSGEVGTPEVPIGTELVQEWIAFSDLTLAGGEDGTMRRAVLGSERSTALRPSRIPGCYWASESSSLSVEMSKKTLNLYFVQRRLLRRGQGRSRTRA